MKPFRQILAGPFPKTTPLIFRKHRDGTVELILCSTGSPIRCSGVDEHEAYSRMAAHLRSY
jgi:hypothetical protein